MKSQQKVQQPGKPFPSWARPLAIVVAIVFFISSLFPIAAAVSKDTSLFQLVWGILDMVITFTLALLAFAIVAVAQGKIDKDAESATYRAYRLLIHTIFDLIRVFFLFGDRIVWVNGLPDIGWRAWLLLYCLRSWFAAVNAQHTDDSFSAA